MTTSSSPRPGDCDRSLTPSGGRSEESSTCTDWTPPCTGLLDEPPKSAHGSLATARRHRLSAASRQGGLLSGLLMEGSGGGRLEIDSSARHPPTRSFAPAQDDRGGKCRR